MNSLKKKINLFFLYFVIIIIIISFTFITFIWNSKLEFAVDTKNNIITFKNTFRDLRQLINDYNEVFLPETQFVKLKFEEIKLDLKSYKSSTYNIQFFIEIIENDLFLIQSAGPIYKIQNINSEKEIAYLKKKEVKTNLNNIVKYNIFDKDDEEEYLQLLPKDFKKNSNESLTVSPIHVLDSLVIKNNIFISLKFRDNKECYKYKIFESEILKDELKFEELISIDECGDKSILGGRMINYNHEGKDGILMTTSIVRKDNPSNLPQDSNSIMGKVIFIDFKTKEITIFAKGHRNPQGLYGDKDIILLTEHGPKGGDEINKIQFNKNYGWPIASYGDKYINDQNLPQYLKNHKKEGFEEPIFSYTPAIGISEIVKVPKGTSPFWENNFLVSSLHGNSLYRVMFDEEYNKILFNEKIFIGSRIRDLKFSENGNTLMLALEYKNGVLGILRFNNSF